MSLTIEQKELVEKVENNIRKNYLLIRTDLFVGILILSGTMTTGSAYLVATKAIQDAATTMAVKNAVEDIERMRGEAKKFRDEAEANATESNRFLHMLKSQHIEGDLTVSGKIIAQNLDVKGHIGGKRAQIDTWLVVGGLSEGIVLQHFRDTDAPGQIGHSRILLGYGGAGVLDPKNPDGRTFNVYKWAISAMNDKTSRAEIKSFNPE